MVACMYVTWDKKERVGLSGLSGNWSSSGGVSGTLIRPACTDHGHGPSETAHSICTYHHVHTTMYS